MREIVADYPLAPGDLHPVGIFSKARQEAALAFRTCRRGIECLPVHARKVDFHPAMRVACANDVISAQFVVFARQETVHFARRNTEGAQHDSHCRSEVFAVARASLEQKMSKRIVSGSSGQIQSVS